MGHPVPSFSAFVTRESSAKFEFYVALCDECFASLCLRRFFVENRSCGIWRLCCVFFCFCFCLHCHLRTRTAIDLRHKKKRELKAQASTEKPDNRETGASAYWICKATGRTTRKRKNTKKTGRTQRTHTNTKETRENTENTNTHKLIAISANQMSRETIGTIHRSPTVGVIQTRPSSTLC